MYKWRKETTYERVGERKTYINNIEEKYLRKKEKKRYIISSLHSSKRNNTPPNTMIQKLTLPLRVTTLISKTIDRLQTE